MQSDTKHAIKLKSTQSTFAIYCAIAPNAVIDYQWNQMENLEVFGLQ